MLPTQKKQFKNRLAHFRLHRKMAQKEVAQLLGYKNTTPIERLESGVGIPNLKTSLKLAQIYNVPIRVMLDEYYEACLEEIRQQEFAASKRRTTETVVATSGDFREFCTYEQKLAEPLLHADELTKVRRHSTYLVRKTAERMGHL